MPDRSPLILVAASISPSALQVASLVEKAVQHHFPARPYCWAYNTRTVRRAVKDGRSDIRLPSDLLEEFAAAGHRQVTIQSLQLLPGTEFHELRRELNRMTTMDVRLAMPLLSSPADYHLLIDELAPPITASPDSAVLLVGHGSRHPVWTAYLALETLLRLRFGPRMFVGVVEHFPETATLVDQIVSAGFSRVLLIPLFITAGLHVSRDILGPSEHSWRSRLLRAGLEVDTVSEGIGSLPVIGALAVRHISEADQQG